MKIFIIITLLILSGCSFPVYKEYQVTYNFKITYDNGDVQMLSYTTNITRVSGENPEKYGPRLTEKGCIFLWTDIRAFESVNVTCGVRSFGYSEPTKIEEI